MTTEVQRLSVTEDRALRDLIEEKKSIAAACKMFGLSNVGLLSVLAGVARASTTELVRGKLAKRERAAARAAKRAAP